MISHDLICDAAQRIEDFARVNGGPECAVNPLPLFESVGLDKDRVAHMFQHAKELGLTTQDEGKGFGWGVLFASLMHYEPAPELTDEALSELLKAA